MATTFSLKQGETRTSHEPIPHPLTSHVKPNTTERIRTCAKEMSCHARTTTVRLHWHHCQLELVQNIEVITSNYDVFIFLFVMWWRCLGQWRSQPSLSGRGKVKEPAWFLPILPDFSSFSQFFPLFSILSLFFPLYPKFVPLLPDFCNFFAVTVYSAPYCNTS